MLESMFGFFILLSTEKYGYYLIFNIAKFIYILLNKPENLKIMFYFAPLLKTTIFHL